MQHRLVFMNSLCVHEFIEALLSPCLNFLRFLLLSRVTRLLFKLPVQISLHPCLLWRCLVSVKSSFCGAVGLRHSLFGTCPLLEAPVHNSTSLSMYCRNNFAFTFERKTKSRTLLRKTTKNLSTSGLTIDQL